MPGFGSMMTIKKKKAIAIIASTLATTAIENLSYTSPPLTLAILTPSYQHLGTGTQMVYGRFRAEQFSRRVSEGIESPRGRCYTPN